MKRLITVLLGLAVVGIAAVCAAGATGGTARSVTFHLIEKQIGFNFIDNPPRQGPNEPPLMGDQFVFTAELQTRSGQHAGLLDATCILTRGGRGASGPCYGSYSFKGGQIMAMATVNFASSTTQIAVVGGTGVYKGVTGTIVSVSRGENSSFSDDTFHLLLP